MLLEHAVSRVQSPLVETTYLQRTCLWGLSIGSIHSVQTVPVSWILQPCRRPACNRRRRKFRDKKSCGRVFAVPLWHRARDPAIHPRAQGNHCFGDCKLFASSVSYIQQFAQLCRRPCNFWTGLCSCVNATVWLCKTSLEIRAKSPDWI